MEQYEKHWEALKFERTEEFQSRVRSEKDFRDLITFLNIAVIGVCYLEIVEVIGEEIICAGLNQSN